MQQRSSPTSTHAQLALPTPCAQWDVRATLDHLIGATWMFTLVNQDQAVGEDAGGIGGDDPVVALTNAAEANVASWRAPGAFDGDRTFPFGTFPADAAAMMNLSEVVVHTWDIATALGADATIDPTVAEMVYEFYRPMSLDPYRAHGAFGAEIPVDAERPACRSAARAARSPAGVTAMHVQALGHVVLKVRDAQRAEHFYGGTLGIPVAGRVADPVPMTSSRSVTITTSPSWNSVSTDHHPIGTPPASRTSRSRSVTRSTSSMPSSANSKLPAS